jgi:hypothetical protein
MNVSNSNSKSSNFVVVVVMYMLMLAFGVGMLLGGWENIQDDGVASSLQQRKEAVVVKGGNYRVNVQQNADGAAILPIAWLMSFPNSGTSYTMGMVKKVTGLNPASNYGKESRGEDGLSVAVFATNGSVAGPPFWNDPISQTLVRPSKGYILTKTHCGSRCNNCGVSKYVENHALFLQHCLEGRYHTKVGNGKLIERVGTYDKALVQRAVHLIRDPFDNVVSRFHLHYNNLVKRNRTDQVALYPRTRDGFRRFCSDQDRHFYSEEKQSKFYQDVFDTVKDVPCHADFYRYVQWHNLAFITIWNLEIPSLIIHYENYANNFNKTKDTLLDFVGQSGIYDAPPFVSGKTYREYYLQEEIDNVYVLFVKLALEKTWSNTKHYFGSKR